MAHSLADLKTQLRDRLTELRPLVDEYRQLERAAGALGIDDEQPQAASKPRRRGAPKTQAKVRAPKGANKAAITAVLAERPGVTVAEIAEATGIAKPLIYNTTRTGITQGDMEAVNLGGGRKGYKLAGVDATSGSDAPPPTAPDPVVDAESEVGSAQTDSATTAVETPAADSSDTAKSSPKRTRKRPGKRKAASGTAGDGSNDGGTEAASED